MREFKHGDMVIYPLGVIITPKSKTRTGKIVGYGRYDDQYVVEDETGIIPLRLDDKYKKWLKSYNESQTSERKKKSSKVKSKRK